MLRWVMVVSLALAVISPSTVAQTPNPVPPFYWTGWVLGGGGLCGVCAYDTAGNQVSGFPLGPLASPSVAKHPSGTVVVANSSTGSITAYTLTSPVVTITSPGVIFVAADVSGDVFGLTQGLFTPTTLSRYTASGSTVWTASLNVFLPLAMRSDGNGRAWVVDAATGQVFFVDAAGATFGPFPSPVPGVAIGFDLDAQGQVWLLMRATAAAPAFLVRMDPLGATNLIIPLSGVPLALALDACGRPHVLDDSTVPQTIQIIDPVSGLLATSIGLSTSTQHESLAIDTLGNYFLSSVALAGFGVFDPGGLQLTSVVGGTLPSPAADGDKTGLRLCSVVDPTGDADLDGFPNLRELQLGKDPLDPASVPVNMTLAGTVFGGQTFSVSGTVPGEAGNPYLIGASLGTGGIPLAAPDCRMIPLSFDALLQWWLGAGNVVTTGVTGALDASGTGTATVALPPGVYGNTQAFFAMVTLDPLSLSASSVSDALTVVLP